MGDHIRVSDIVNYARCPRKVYYTYRGIRPVGPLTSSYAASMLIKEMAMHFPEIMVSEDMDAAAKELLDICVDQLTAIYPAEVQQLDEEILLCAADDVRSHLGEMITGLRTSIERLGTEKLLEIFTSSISEPLLHSEKFHISGSPNRLFSMHGSASVSIIRTGSAPPSGVWEEDRIRLAALTILLEEVKDCQVDRGLVEYARYGIIREVIIRRADRRKVLVLGSRVRKLRNGSLPERPENAHCNYCGYKDACQIAPTLASKYF